MMFATSIYTLKESATVPLCQRNFYFLSKKTFLFFIPLNFCYFYCHSVTAYKNGNNNIQIIK